MKDDTGFYVGLLVVVVVVTAIMLFMLNSPLPSATEVETYTEGYEITHMEIDRGRAYISARNDNDAFTIKVSGETFAQYEVGDICEVEVRIMEYKTENYNEYTILGLDK